MAVKAQKSKMKKPTGRRAKDYDQVKREAANYSPASGNPSKELEYSVESAVKSGRNANEQDKIRQHLNKYPGDAPIFGQRLIQVPKHDRPGFQSKTLGRHAATNDIQFKGK